jgi:hypothetical protein
MIIVDVEKAQTGNSKSIQKIITKNTFPMRKFS